MPSDSEGPADNIRRTARQWRAIVEQVQQSQLTEGDFCKQYDLGRTTFGRWRRRFLSEDHNPGFVQIQLAGPAGVLSAALVIGLGAVGVLVALQTSTASFGGFLVLAAAAVALLLAFLAVAYLLGVLFLDRLRAMGAAVAVWFVTVVGYDLAVIGLSSLLKGVTLKTVLLPAILLNPVDLCRVVVTLAGGRGALFGPAGATLVDVFGSTGGGLLAAGALLVHVSAPLIAAVLAFRRRDL